VGAGANAGTQATLPVATLAVVFGESDPEAKTAKHLTVAKVTVHPQFDAASMAKSGDNTIRLAATNDLAIWHLAEAVKDAAVSRVLPAERVTEVFTDNHPLVLSGFGEQSAWESPWRVHTFAVAETPFHTQYEQTSITVVTRDGHPFKNTQTVQLPALGATEFYAGGRGLPDTCKGDSGSPVFVRDSDSLELVGITSRGSSTCDEGGVYTLVAAYIPWLRGIVGELNVR
jgi:secreted trypsin-like serine protease